MVNKSLLVGYVGSDPEAVYLDSGSLKLKISLATNESYRNAKGELIKDTQWHTVVFFGKLAETANKFIKKGNLLLIEGRISYYETDDNRKYTSIVVGMYRVLSGLKNSEDDYLEEMFKERKRTHEYKKSSDFDIIAKSSNIPENLQKDLFDVSLPPSDDLPF